LADAPAHWTRREKQQTLAVALAPLGISLACGAIGGLGAWAGLVLALPGYLTLFLFVMPCLWLLRRTGKEKIWSFAAACGLGTVLPWFALYAAFLGDPTLGRYTGATGLVATWLLLPGGLAAICGAIIYQLGREGR